MPDPPFSSQKYSLQKNTMQRYRMFHRDIIALKKRANVLGLTAASPQRTLLEWSYNLTLAMAPSFAFFYADSAVLKILLVILAGAGLAGIGTAAHNASHGTSTSSHKLNRFLEYTGFGFLAGVSPNYWRYTHNEVHHTKTNIIEADKDTNLMPWYALHRKNLENIGPVKNFYYKYQWIHFPFLAGLNGIDIQAAGLWHMTLRLFRAKEPIQKYFPDIVIIVLHYLFWIGLFTLFFSFRDALYFYFWRNYVTGYALFFIIAPTHFPREAVYLEQESLQIDDYSRQVISTINYKTGFFGGLLSNGIENHIQHHLFPEVSHVHAERLGDEIQKLCHKHGLPYRTCSWGDAILKSYHTLYNPKPVDNRQLDTILNKPEP